MGWPAPVHADFNLTNGCNLGCTHCHSASGTRLPDELVTADVLKALDDLHALGVIRVAIAGGEPFLRPDIADILAHACELPGWSVSVITNGTYLTPERLDVLETRCPDLSINISLDGSTARHFGILRRPRSGRLEAVPRLFNTVLTAIRLTAASSLRTSVNFTMTRPQLEDLQPTYDLVVGELGVDAMVAIKFFPGGFGRQHVALLEIPFPMWSAFFADLTERKLGGEFSQLQLSVPAPWEFYLPLIHHGLDLDRAEEAWGYQSPLRSPSYARLTSVGDPGGVATLVVSPDGAVYPSVLLDRVHEYRCGQLGHDGLAPIWENSPVLQRLRESDFARSIEGCSGCPIWGLCGGGSRARAVTGGGRLNAPDYLCPLTTLG